MVYMVYAKRSKPIKENFDVIDVSEEHLAHARLVGSTKNDKLKSLKYEDSRLDTNRIGNPLVIVDFKPLNMMFVSDPRMVDDIDLIKKFITISMNQPRAFVYAISSSELNKASSAVQKLLANYQQSHPNFVDHLNVSHSYTVVYKGDELYHHGVRGMRWGVVHEEDDKKPRSSHGTGQHEGYISPNYNSGGTSNKPGSSNRMSFDFDGDPICTSSGCEIAIRNDSVKNANNNNSYLIGISGDNIRRTFENNPDKMYSVIYDKVVSQLKKFKIYMTDKQIDNMAWRLMYAVNKNKKLWV